VLKTAQIKSKSWFSLCISTKAPLGHAQQHPRGQPLLAGKATDAVRDYLLLQTSLALCTATLAEFQTEIHFRKCPKAVNCGVYHYYGYSGVNLFIVTCSRERTFNSILTRPVHFSFANY